MSYRYPLQTYPWSFFDRLKAASFVLNPRNRLTMGPKVREYEQQFVKFYGNTVHAVAVTSGSIANHLMLETWITTKKININDVTFFANCTTWSSNLSPVIMRGGKIELIDINKHDLSMDYDKLESAIKKNKSKVKVIWVTALIGFSCNMDRLQEIATKYNCELFGDLCEASFSEWKGKPLVSYFDLSTTSTFLAHFTSSCEGGMLFIRNDLDYYFNSQLIRNHGLTRSLDKENHIRKAAEKKNPYIDPEFLFQTIGSNFRMSELHAVLGILDFQRVPQYIENRKKLWNYFLDNISDDYYKDFSKEVVPFCIPIILSDSHTLFVGEIKAILNQNGWETRPIICDMSIAPAYKHLAGKKRFLNSFWLRKQGCYVGLSNNLTIKDIGKLLNILNN